MKKRIATTLLVSLLAVNLMACQKSNLPVVEIGDDTNIETGNDTVDTPDVSNTPDTTDNNDVVDSSNQDDELKAKLINQSGYSNESVYCYVRDDFDGDGKYEAFAIVGDGVDEDFNSIINSQAWFVSDSKCEKLDDSHGMGLRNEIRLMKMGDITYIMIDQLYVSESKTTAYYMSNGQPEVAAFSGIGSVWPDENDASKFTITDSSYDMTWDKEIGSTIGHTWKKYYFFYSSEDGKIYEYAGTTIDDATVKHWCGRDLVNELVPKGDKIGAIFMRGNGLIAFNYEHTDEFGSIHYYHYIYDTSKKTFIDDYGQATNEDPQAGIYHNCLIPALANYPQVPGPNNMVWYGQE